MMLKRRLFVLSTVLAAAFIAGGEEDHDTIAGPAAVTARADQLEKTVVTPYLDHPIPPETNVVWCATFQLAWDQLCDAAGGSVLLEPKAEESDVLNRGRIDADELDPSSYVAVAGLGPAAVERIKKELRDRFSGAARPRLLPTSATKQEWIVYSYLFLHLPFETAFTRKERSFTFAGRKVAGFGIEQYLPRYEKNEARMAEQVLVHDYRDQFDFIVELESSNSAHRIILACVPPEKNLAGTVDAVNARLSEAEPARMVENSNLGIPVIDFDLLATFSRLQGRTIVSKNPDIDGTSLAVAQQTIRFRLDETGAVLKSDAIEVWCAGQSLVFEKPFLVLLQKQGARRPYFALWVANAELLAPFSKENESEAEKK